MLYIYVGKCIYLSCASVNKSLPLLSRLEAKLSILFWNKMDDTVVFIPAMVDTVVFIYVMDNIVVFIY